MAAVSRQIQEPNPQKSTQHYDVDIDMLSMSLMLMPAAALLMNLVFGATMRIHRSFVGVVHVRTVTGCIWEYLLDFRPKNSSGRLLPKRMVLGLTRGCWQCGPSKRNDSMSPGRPGW